MSKAGEFIVGTDGHEGHWLTGEEIVRCRDCVSCYRDEDGMWCCLYGTGFYRSPRYEGDYCSRGKRRDA